MVAASEVDEHPHAAAFRQLVAAKRACAGAHSGLLLLRAARPAVRPPAARRPDAGGTQRVLVLSTAPDGGECSHARPDPNPPSVAALHLPPARPLPSAAPAPPCEETGDADAQNELGDFYYEVRACGASAEGAGRQRERACALVAACVLC